MAAQPFGMNLDKEVVYECENDCGFSGTFAVVAGHEESCAGFAPAAAGTECGKLTMETISSENVGNLTADQLEVVGRVEAIERAVFGADQTTVRGALFHQPCYALIAARMQLQGSSESSSGSSSGGGGGGRGGASEAVVGYVLTRTNSLVGSICWLAVDPAWRRHGAAEYLVGQALQAMRASPKKVQTCTLTVSPTNAAAVALYRKVGFAPEGEIKRDFYAVGQDAMAMEMQLL